MGARAEYDLGDEDQEEQSNREAFNALCDVLYEVNPITLDKIIDHVRRECLSMLFFIGNGGSAAIASHMAADWTKAAKRKAMSLSDIPALTAWSNDNGYENVYSEQLKMFAQKGDFLFAISSSGRSANIINAAEQALDTGMTIVTLTGFDKDNPLSKMGDYNIHVPSHKYGLVEVAHHAILHHILDRTVDE